MGGMVWAATVAASIPGTTTSYACSTHSAIAPSKPATCAAAVAPPTATDSPTTIPSTTGLCLHVTHPSWRRCAS